MNARILAALASLIAVAGCSAPTTSEGTDSSESQEENCGWFCAKSSNTPSIGTDAGDSISTAKPSNSSTSTSTNNTTTNDTAKSAANNATTDSLPVLVTWNAVANTEASLDVILNDGTAIGPCVGVDVLRAELQSGESNGLAYLFTGQCVSASTSPAPADIKAFRICSAVIGANGSDDWAHATCTESAPWNHTNNSVHIDNH